jgi:hypothetical protein
MVPLAILCRSTKVICCSAMELLVWSCRILIRQQTQTYKPNISVIYSSHSRNK